MKIILASILFLFLGSVCPQAAHADCMQPQTKENISKDAFRKKQKDYIIRKAGLSPKEANYFFPLFFELQDKKKILNDDMMAKMKKAKDQELHERQYESVINQIINAQIDIEQLERNYIDKYRKYLSNKKIFKVLLAETNFRREMLKSASGKQNSK